MEEKETKKVEQAKQEETKKKEKMEKQDSKPKKVKKQKAETKKVKEKEEPSKGKTVLKVVFILIFIILLAVALNWTRNYLIMSDILEKMSQYENIQNYSYIISQNTGEVTNVTVKDNITKITYTTNGTEKLISWNNVETQETIAAFPEAKQVSYTAKTLTIKNPFSTEILQGWKDNIIYLALTSFIPSENVKGQDCYVINRFQNGKLWVNKETGIKVKAEEGKILDSGVTEPLIVEYTDWKINTITDEDVAKPDLVGYTIIE